MPEDKFLYIPARNCRAQSDTHRSTRTPERAFRRLYLPEFSMKKLLLAAAIASLAACTTTNPDVVQRYDAQRLSQVQDATVLTVRPVVVDGSQSGIGGTRRRHRRRGWSSVGGSREAIAVGVIGAVAGAVVGNAIERAGTREDAFEILVQLRNGERRAIVQAKGSESFNPGDAVILVTTGGKTRVMRAPGRRAGRRQPAGGHAGAPRRAEPSVFAAPLRPPRPQRPAARRRSSLRRTARPGAGCAPSRCRTAWRRKRSSGRSPSSCAPGAPGGSESAWAIARASSARHEEGAVLAQRRTSSDPARSG